MRISLTFLNDETKIELYGENDAERRVLGIIKEHDRLRIESVKHDDNYSGWNRPYFEEPTSLVFHLTKPEPIKELGEGEAI